MKRILTGIQSSGKPHLGNILGAILPAIDLSKVKGNECFFFIADLHSLTTLKNSASLKENVYSVAAAWLAFGFDTNLHTFYRQSRILEVCELTWYLSCFMPFARLKLAHSFKDKSNKLTDINSGLFIYPILMCSDILLYDAEIIPVGKDQKQHIEFAKFIAERVNQFYSESIFVVPKIMLDKKAMLIPGIDGQKMSKSYNNYIDVFKEKNELRKDVMSIVTDTKTLEEPKDPSTCNVFKLYSSVATEAETSLLRDKYLGGNYGYGDAKKELFEILWTRFANEREKYIYYMNHTEEIEKLLQEGEQKATKIARTVIERLRIKLGTS
jgi:tryptophanyl-tRNA synthetase